MQSSPLLLSLLIVGVFEFFGGKSLGWNSQAICRESVDKRVGQRHVLVLYTGGTIGMVPHNDTTRLFVNRAGAFVDGVKNFPELNDKKFKPKTPYYEGAKATLALPAEKGLKHRIVYTIIEYEHLIDSTNIEVADWMRIANDIAFYYKAFDAFVILHGTDTLAYTASMLSFLFEGLSKTVVITGAQIPMFQPNSDGTANFKGAVSFAGSLLVPQVVVYFDRKLFRGNRVLKVHSLYADAFSSPNLEPLFEFSEAGIEPRQFGKCTDQLSHENFAVNAQLTNNVVLVKLFPSMRAEVLEAMLAGPVEGAVIESYGAGNMPTARDDLMQVIKRASERGVIVINVSQCLAGGTSVIYETGSLEQYGVNSGYDMTPVAAFTKLLYVLSQDVSMDEKLAMIDRDLRGEMNFGRTPMRRMGSRFLF